MSVRTMCVVIALAGTMAVTTLAQPKRIEIVQPFDYPALGVGPQLREVLIVRPGEEDDVASRAIVTGLQHLQHSLVDAPKLLAKPLAPGRDYAVETARLSDADIRAHNDSYPTTRLPTTAIYGVSYKIRYEIHKDEKNRRLLVLLTPTLYHRGTASKWREYREDYSGEFFATRVVRAITEQFTDLLRTQKLG
jgi:hypothetical protein